MNRTQEREAWTAAIEGRKPKRHKYGAKTAGKYASKHEADVAMKLAAMERSGLISDLKEQVCFVLIEGKNGVKEITYVADFTYIENAIPKVADAKAWDEKKRRFLKTKEFRLKEKMMYLLLGITVELL